MVPNSPQEDSVAHIEPMLLSTLERGLHTAKLFGEAGEVFVVFQRLRCCI